MTIDKQFAVACGRNIWNVIWQLCISLLYFK